MNKSIEVLKKIYKPYRYTIQGNVTILNTTSGDFVIKEKKEKDMRELFSYLESRSFTNFPPLVDDARQDVNVYHYVSGVSMPYEQKALDLIEVLANLHNKTTYYKNVTEDDFKTVYDTIKSNIVYLNHYYNELYETIKKEIYMSPSHYSFIRNISKIFSCLSFVESELDQWFSMVKEETKKRISYIHNNLSLEHFIKGNQDYLISWENYRVDTPIVDLVGLYQKEYFHVNFEVLFSKYLEKVKLTDDEKKLFFILISLPKEISFEGSEFQNCQKVREAMDYLYISEELVRPYYTIQEKN